MSLLPNTALQLAFGRQPLIAADHQWPLATDHASPLTPDFHAPIMRRS